MPKRKIIQRALRRLGKAPKEILENNPSNPRRRRAARLERRSYTASEFKEELELRRLQQKQNNKDNYGEKEGS